MGRTGWRVASQTVLSIVRRFRPVRSQFLGFPAFGPVPSPVPGRVYLRRDGRVVEGARLERV